MYDVDADCRHPELISSLPVGLLGHESGLSPDGNTFYSASPGTSTVQAVALENLPAMTPVWTSVGEYPSHGLSVSDDGNRIYIAGLDGLHIVDVSEVQARVPFPEVTEVAHLTWDTMSIPQNALPVTIDGTPYLIEIDEFGVRLPGRRRADHRHLRRDQADDRLRPAARGPPARALRRDRR